MNYDFKYDAISLTRDQSLSHPVSICLVLGYRCDLNCSYCLNPDVELKDFSHIDTSLLNLLSKWAPIRIVLTGGEPTLYPELLSQVGSTLKKMGHFISVSTHGLHYELLLRMDWVDRVMVSLPGLSPKTYQLMHGINGFDTAVKGIRSMVNAGKKVTINFTVSSYNISEVPSAVGLAGDLGATVLGYEVIFRIGHARKCKIGVSRNHLAHAFEKVPESKNLKILFPSVGKIFDLVEMGLIVAELNGHIYSLSTEPEYLITTADDILFDRNTALFQKNIEANRCLHSLTPEESKKEFWNLCEQSLQQ